MYNQIKTGPSVVKRLMDVYVILYIRWSEINKCLTRSFIVIQTRPVTKVLVLGFQSNIAVIIKAALKYM